jgi:cytochrome c oxidase assembly protein subunit 15
MAFLATVLLTLWLAYSRRAPATVRRALNVLLLVLVAQAAVGYTQYFTGVPVILVAVHVAGATAVFAATAALYLRLRERTATGDTREVRPERSLTRSTLARA